MHTVVNFLDYWYKLSVSFNRIAIIQGLTYCSEEAAICSWTVFLKSNGLDMFLKGSFEPPVPLTIIDP